MKQSGSFDSGTVHVEKAWSVKYSWDCATQLQKGPVDKPGFRYLVSYPDDDSTYAETPLVQKIGKKGSGQVDYHRGGYFDIKVDSACSWQLTVLDTSRVPTATPTPTGTTTPAPSSSR